MADAAVTFSAVFPSASAALMYGYVAAQPTQGGDLVFLNSSSKWELAYATDLTHGAGTGATAFLGVAVNQAVTDMHVTVAIQDVGFTFGTGSLTQGTYYALSTNARKFCPIADLVSTTYRSFIGMAISSAVLNLKITNTGTTT